MDSKELIDLVTSVACLVVASSFWYVVKGDMLHVYALSTAIVLGFVMHEIGHRQVAKALGYTSRYRAWYLGMLLTLISGIASMGRFLFAATGAVEIEVHNLRRIDKDSITLMALAGPIVNIVISLTALAMVPIVTGSARIVATTLATINAFLAFFNLLPLPPLDGHKVYVYGRRDLWVAAVVVSVALLVASMI